MLSISPLGPESAEYIFKAVQKGETFVQSAVGEPCGFWLGSGAIAIGLAGNVTEEQFIPVFNGFRPDVPGRSDGGDQLVQNAGHARRQKGLGLCYSFPKPVSVCYGLAPPHVQKQFESAQRAAIASNIKCMEQVVVYTRRGHAGVELARCGLIAAAFEHGASRSGDVALHTHLLVMNAAVRTSDQTTGAIVTRGIFENKMMLGALYRAELAEQLTKRLGVVITPPNRRVGFGIQGVPESLCDALSSRHAQVVERQAMRGESGARSAEIAALDTRPPKQDYSRDQIYAKCRAVCREHGFSPEQILLDVYASRQSVDRAASLAEAQRLRFPEAIASETEQFEISAEWREEQIDSLFRQTHDDCTAAQDEVMREAETHAGRLLVTRTGFYGRDLIRAFAEDCITSPFGGGADAAIEAGNRFLTSTEIVRVGEDGRGESIYSHKDTLAAEQAMMLDAERLSLTHKHDVSNFAVTAAIWRANRRMDWEHMSRSGWARWDDIDYPQMTNEQEEGVRHLTQKTGSLAILSGSAGSGKSRLLDAAREAWTEMGFTVVGAATIAKAAGNLEKESRIDSATISRRMAELDATFRDRLRHERTQLVRALWGKETYKWDPFRLTAKTVVVIDEASLIDVRTMARLVTAVRRSGAKLVLAGDDHQFSLEERGTAFRNLGERFGVKSLKDVVRLESNRRSGLSEWRRESLKALSEGKVDQALRPYHDRGRIKYGVEENSLRTTLIKTWLNRAGKRPENHFILTGTQEEANDLNTRAQTARKGAGQLGWRSARLPGGTWLYEKDRVILGRSNRGIGVSNGDFGTIVKIDHWNRRYHIRTEHSRKLVAVPFRYRHLELGYAAQIRRVQGCTLQNAYLLIGKRFAEREMLYSQLSRASKESFLFAQIPEASIEDTSTSINHLVALIERLSPKLHQRTGHEINRPSFDVNADMYQDPELEDIKSRIAWENPVEQYAHEQQERSL